MNMQQDDQNRTKERKGTPLPPMDLLKTRAPIGSFAGTQDFVIRIRNGKLVAADTGDQGGGQN
jgi:hypothetical protein